MHRVIVALSGGKASAYCADWAFKNYEKERILLYFNDTKWEHPDLYRFLQDISAYFDHPIFQDSDGRSPEDLFYDQHAIANNRMPFCSRILKAERLQKFCQDGDTLIFGIGCTERQRQSRLHQVYSNLGKVLLLRFPLMEQFHEDEKEQEKKEIDRFFVQAGIKIPELYGKGFLHNNCAGGCVRAGKKQWKLLYDTFPEIYLDRERVENEVSAYFGKRMTIFKDESLEEFRKRIESGNLSNYYTRPHVDQYTLQLDDAQMEESECIGVCGTMN